MYVISEKKLTDTVKTEQIYNNVKLPGLEFISLNSNLISEKEFFKIITFTLYLYIKIVNLSRVLNKFVKIQRF